MTFSFGLIAFSLGVAGSFHCMGMCGPLLMTINMSWKNKKTILQQTIVHHLGRISAYLFMGVLFGRAGELFLRIGVQQKLSIIAGIFLIIILMLSHLGTKGHLWNNQLKKIFGKYFGKQGIKNTYLLGVVNGFLPCGLVFAALATAASSSSPISAGIFMVIFGIGTLPLLLLMTLGTAKLFFLKSNRVKFILPMATIITASLLILRGLNLGIPYVSPEVKIENEQPTMSCCEEKN